MATLNNNLQKLFQQLVGTKNRDEALTEALENHITIHAKLRSLQATDLPHSLNVKGTYCTAHFYINSDNIRFNVRDILTHRPLIGTPEHGYFIGLEYNNPELLVSLTRILDTLTEDNATKTETALQTILKQSPQQ